MDKRIVFVNKYGGYFGGVERYIRDAAMGLRDAGWQVFGLFEHRTNKQADFDVPFETCWYLEDDSKSLNKIKDVHIPTAFIHKFDNLTILEKIAAQFMSVRMVHDHDLYCLRGHKYFPIGRINCHREYSWFCALCSGMVKKNGNGRFHFVSLSKKKKEFELNRKMDTLVTASEFMKRNLVQNGFPSSKIQVIYPDYRFSAKPQLSEGLNIPVQLLFVGQLISGKGVVLLLRALENVGCKFHLDIVGTGNAVTQIQHLIQSLGLSRNTTLHGWVDPLELDEFYRRCDIVLIPSRWQEPFGLVGLEAYRYKKPVIAFRVGGIPEWLQDGVSGVLVPPGDVKKYGLAIARLAKSPILCKTMGDNGFEILKNVFSLGRFVSELEEVLSF